MVTDIICVVSGVAVAYSAFMTYLLKQEKKESERCANIAHKQYRELDKEKHKLEESLYKANREAEDLKSIKLDYDALKQNFEDLAEEHKELQEKYKPLAALNPFERQAVGAVTNQSILDEWMNGEIKEGN